MFRAIIKWCYHHHCNVVLFLIWFEESERTKAMMRSMPLVLKLIYKVRKNKSNQTINAHCCWFDLRVRKHKAMIRSVHFVSKFAWEINKDKSNEVINAFCSWVDFKEEPINDQLIWFVCWFREKQVSVKPLDYEFKTSMSSAVPTFGMSEGIFATNFRESPQNDECT